MISSQSPGPGLSSGVSVEKRKQENLNIIENGEDGWSQNNNSTGLSSFDITIFLNYFEQVGIKIRLDPGINLKFFLHLT